MFAIDNVNIRLKNGFVVPIYAEYHDSGSSLVRYTRGQAVVTGLYDHSVFHPDWDRRYYSGPYATTPIDYFPKWRNFGPSQELVHRLLHGTDDPGILDAVVSDMRRARTADEARLSRRMYDVAGDELDVPRYLAGEPDCFVTYRHRDVRSRLIHIVLNVTVYEYTEVEDQVWLGLDVASALGVLEKAGFRVRLDVTSPTISKFSHRFDPRMLVLTIKDYNQRLNLNRLLFPLCDVAWTRGVQLGWETASFRDHNTRGLEQYVSYNEMVRVVRAVVRDPCTIYLETSNLIHKDRQERYNAIISGLTT